MLTETQVPLTETKVEATVKDGGPWIDDRVDFPNESRVEVTIRPLPPLTAGKSEPTPGPWESLKQFLREHPLNSGGVKFTREELYDGN